MSESERTTEAGLSADLEPEGHEETAPITAAPPVVVSAGPTEEKVKAALREAKLQELDSLADALRLQTDLNEELKATLEQAQSFVGDLADASSRHQESAEKLARRLAELEERDGIQPSVAPAAAPASSRKRPRWL